MMKKPMRLFKRFWGKGAAKAASTASQEAVQAPEDFQAVTVTQTREAATRPSELEEERLWQLFGRAILIEVCKRPEIFGLKSESSSLLELYTVARGLQRSFWETLKLAEGDLSMAVDPTLPVWRTAARLTELDWKRVEAEAGGK
jgi:hypothetical protein